jgi:formate dehydrogenase alpha subunit
VETITIVLDGVEVSGLPGTTILDLARESGVYIPTLCHDPNLKSVGACRLCLVEDERNGALLASCVAPIAPGMVIKTRSPRVVEHRKRILKLILASHPDTCLVCDKGNRCQLRKLAAEMGIGLVEYQKIPQPDVIEEVNPFIERDLTKCIMCGKCIRADQELVVEGAIDYIDRGAAVRPATLNDTPLEKSECTFCGTCVAICPTGALMEKDRAYTGTAPVTVTTVCPYCGCGCTVCLGVKDDRVIYSRPLANGAVNRGTLCVRGSYGYDFIHSSDRLGKPLIKTDGEFREAAWDEALAHVAAEFNRIKAAHGADALAAFGSPRCTNEENYLLQRFARGVLGTNNIDNGSRLYNAASRMGLGISIGHAGTTGTLDYLEKSQVIMVIGADPEISSPAVAYAIKRAARLKGAELIIVDPRRTSLVQFARTWFRPRVGTDIALLNGMAKVIIDEKKLDTEFVTRMTDNFARWADSLREYTPARVQELSGVPARDLAKVARTLAGAERASIVYGNGITQQSNGAGAVRAIANLAMLTGNAGRRGGIFALQQENNALGACDMGTLPAFLPGYQSIEDAQARKKFEGRWQCSLPAGAGLTSLEMMAAAAAGTVRGIFIMGENPAASFPRPSAVKTALAGLDFLVVADMFMTETAGLASVVLPAASFAEKTGTFTNFAGMVQRVNRAIGPVGESIPDGEIIMRLAAMMDSGFPYKSQEEILYEIEEMVPFYHQAAWGEAGIIGPDWAEEEVPLGSRRLHRGPFPSGFGRFSAVDYIPSQKSGDAGYPLTLMVGSSRYRFGSGTRSSYSSRLSRFSPEAFLEISETDAGDLGIRDGDEVRVISSEGEIGTRARVSDVLPGGLLYLPRAFPGGHVLELFPDFLDDQVKAPPLKTCAVRLERTAAHA